MPIAEIPAPLVRTVVRAWGARGRRWLAELPTLVDVIAEDWGIDVGEPFALLSYHWVGPVTTADGRPAVLKVGLTEPGHLNDEAAALRAYGGQGAVRLLAYDAARGALLLERAQPGTPARDLVPHADEAATDAVIGALRQLHRTPPAGVPDVADQGVAFNQYLRDFPAGGPLPRDVVERAGRLFAELCASADRRVLLHGDLHHDNLLRAEREPWLAIDPDGVAGDPGYDLGALLYNPDPDLRDDALLALVPGRVERLADGLGVPFERAVAWGFVKAVLSEVWSTEDAGYTRPGRQLDVALALMPRL